RADLSLTKVLDSGPDASGNSTFTLTLANAGPSPSSGVAVTDYPSTGAAFVSAAAQTSALADGTFDGTTNVWTLPALAAGTQAQIHVVYNTPVAPDTNFAQVTASAVNDPDSSPDTTSLSSGNPPDEDDEASAGFAASGDLHLTNQLTTAPTYVGEAAEFTVTVTNDGPTNTTGVMVTDLLPAGLQYTGSTPSVGTYDSSTGVWNIGPMADGAVVTLVLDARVTTAGTLTTTAEVTASTAADVDSTPGNHVGSEDDQADAAATTTGSSIGDTVWFDVDHDFVVDPGETRLANVAVGVRWAGPNATFGDGDDIVATHTTDASGNWLASGLPIGDYRVTVDTSTLPYGITTAIRDRDGTATPSITSFTIAGGQSLTDVDFAYVGSGSIGDTVFLDADNDHAPDPGEGIGNATVGLRWFGPDGTADATPGGDDIVFSTTTAVNGSYQFVDLPAGSFAVGIGPSSLPAGLQNTVDPDGGNDDGAAATLSVGESRQDLDFGYGGTNTIGDTVYSDVDGNQTQSSGEPGLGGVTVTLLRDLDTNGSYETVVATAVTAGAGTYSFAHLPGGAYRVDVTLPAGLTLSTAATVAATVTTHQTILTADFGLHPPATAPPGALGDRVWNDANSDGVQQAGEPGLPGVRVDLQIDADGDGTFATIATQTTGNDGAYGYANLPTGNYRVAVTTPTGFNATTAPALRIDLAAAGSVLTADFGFTAGTAAPGAVGDTVWNDLDADGTQDPGEPGIAGATVTLRSDANGDGVYETVAATTSTDAQGMYTLDGLAPATYTVSVTPPAGTNPTTPLSRTVAVTSGATVDTADFGLTSGAVAASSIGDRVWLDTNRDGIQDASEPGVNGVTVTLSRDGDHDGSYEAPVATVSTSGDGNYTFAGLAPGSYRVVVTPPGGLATTRPPVLVALRAGANVTDADVGLAPAAPLPFDVQIVKSIEGSVVTGEDMTWVLTVSDNGIGSSPANLTVTDTLIDSLTFRSASGTGWTCSANGQTVTCTGGGPLAPGQSTTIRIVTTVSGAGGTVVNNSASVAAAGIELSLSNNASNAVGQVASLAPVVTTTTTTTPDPAPTTVAPATTVPVTDPTPSKPLPSTGWDIESWLLAAAVLLIGGIVTVRVRRRPYVWVPLQR
ncbi:MAG: hypothetical protein JWN39_3110, partial [Ilumatobacteraceae bacterium]|nr:hypothetical protein [Ilumatobacteraceae bacterium]